MIATPLMSTRCVYPDVFTVLKSSHLIILGKPAFKNKLPCICFIYLVMDLKTKPSRTVMNNSTKVGPKPPLKNNVVTNLVLEYVSRFRSYFQNLDFVFVQIYDHSLKFCKNMPGQ